MSDSAPHFENDAMLDNPIWNSLVSCHAHLAVGADVGNGLARRYPSDIGPLSGVREQTPKAYADLAAIVPEHDVAVLFLEGPAEPPADWQVLRSGTLVQMVCSAIPQPVPLVESIVPLKSTDSPEMVALAALTDPGPFRAQTARLGGFLGIRVDGRLAAMAGQRLAPPGFAEVSAVCTHPDFRGRGLAGALVAAVTGSIYAQDALPFLTVFETNKGAMRIYQQAGFVVRRTLHLAVLKPLSSRP